MRKICLRVVIELMQIYLTSCILVENNGIQFIAIDNLLDITSLADTISFKIGFFTEHLSTIV